MIDGKPDIRPEIEKFTKLKKRGKYFIGLCPIHEEKTPSFYVNEEKQICACWGCGFYGDVIDFIMKLHNFNFKDACRYLGIIPGKPAPIDPAIQRQKKIQKDYEMAISNLYESFCKWARNLHALRIQVERNPGALTEQGAALFAERMGELAAIDFKIDLLLKGDFEDKIFLLRGHRDAHCSGEIRSAAA
jgi:DNA primase